MAYRKINKKTNNSLPNATLKSKYWATQTVTCILYSFYFIQVIWTTIRYCFAHQSFNQALRLGERPSNSPFLKNNGAEAHCFKGMERYEDILQLKIHPLYFINFINY